jgi:hypothetical protein
MTIYLEDDLFKTEHIRNKCKQRESYAQNLYAAMCNNRFIKNNKEWTASWRYSGSIVSELIGAGNDPNLHLLIDDMAYLDWYCSGMFDKEGYVPEGTVTDEIRQDLLDLGWEIQPYSPRLEPGIYRNQW